MSDPLNAFVPESNVFVPGASSGPLAGLTFAAKDIFDVAGHVTGGGNPDWARTHAPADRTAPVVQALLDAGATLIGKTITDELTLGLLGINAHYGTPVNASAPGCVPGGSSSGSASAVAGGLVDFALGSDTGGSVRVPSSFCGLYGIRPTHGRLALDGVIEQAPSFDTIGWFARDGATLARAGATLLGASGSADACSQLVVAEDAFALADDAVVAALAPALDSVKAHVETHESLRLCPTELRDWQQPILTTQQFEASRSFADWIDRTNPRFSYDVAQRFVAAASVTKDDVDAVQGMRQAHRERMTEILTPGTVVALPSTPFPALPVGLAQSEMWDARPRITALTCIAGSVGLPQVSLPLAAVDGKPVGLSLIGPSGSDETLLALAEQVSA